MQHLGTYLFIHEKDRRSKKLQLSGSFKLRRAPVRLPILRTRVESCKEYYRYLNMLDHTVIDDREAGYRSDGMVDVFVRWQEANSDYLGPQP
jgi:hypothetical protein